MLKRNLSILIVVLVCLGSIVDCEAKKDKKKEKKHKKRANEIDFTTLPEDYDAEQVHTLNQTQMKSSFNLICTISMPPCSNPNNCSFRYYIKWTFPGAVRETVRFGKDPRLSVSPILFQNGTAGQRNATSKLLIKEPGNIHEGAYICRLFNANTSLQEGRRFLYIHIPYLSNEKGDCIQNDHCVSRHCDFKTKKCLYCSSDASVATHHKCVKPRQLSDYCSYDEQCMATMGRKAHCKSKKCDCSKGYEHITVYNYYPLNVTTRNADGLRARTCVPKKIKIKEVYGKNCTFSEECDHPKGTNHLVCRYVVTDRIVKGTCACRMGYKYDPFFQKCMKSGATMFKPTVFAVVISILLAIFILN